jgi:hypothetical protein
MNSFNTTIKSWRDVLSVHPAADMFPLLSETDPAALRELGENIRERGLQEPVVVYCDDEADPSKPTSYSLLDGRNRLDAMEVVGIPFELVFVRWRGRGCWELRDPESCIYQTLARVADHGIRVETGGDPYEYVISANIHRRHLTPEKKREMIAAVIKARPESSNRVIAKTIKADHKTVGAIRNKLESTGEVSPVEKTVGADGKARRQTAKKRKATKQEPLRVVATTTAPPPDERVLPMKVAATATEPPSTEQQPTPVTVEAAKRAKEEKREILAAEVERLASQLIRSDREAACELHKLLWADVRGTVFRLTCALGRGLGVDDDNCQSDSEAGPSASVAPNDGLDIPDYLRRVPKEAAVS